MYGSWFTLNHVKGSSFELGDTSRIALLSISLQVSSVQRLISKSVVVFDFSSLQEYSKNVLFTVEWSGHLTVNLACTELSSRFPSTNGTLSTIFVRLTLHSNLYWAPFLHVTNLNRFNHWPPCPNVPISLFAGYARFITVVTEWKWTLLYYKWSLNINLMIMKEKGLAARAKI